MSTSKLEKILLIGATGTIGIHILNAFTASVKSFKRVAIYTSSNTVEKKKELVDKLQAAGVDVIVGDLSDDKRVKETFEGFDTIISALGRGALHLQPSLMDLAASVSPPIRFYPSEYGTDIRYSPATSPHEIPHQNKLKVRAHIEALAARGALTYTYIVTGPFADTFFLARAGGFTGLNVEAGTYGIVGPQDPTQQAKISGTTYSDTARYVLSSVLSPPRTTANATLRVSSFTSTPAEMHAAMEKVLGKKLKIKYTDLDKYRALERKKWEEKDPTATVYTLQRIWYEGGSDFSKKPLALYMNDSGQDEEDADKAKDLFKDIPKLPLEEVIREVLTNSGMI